MATTPPPHPVPLDIKKVVFDTCPWRISDPLFGEMQTQGKVPIKKCKFCPLTRIGDFPGRFSITINLIGMGLRESSVSMSTIRSEPSNSTSLQ